MKKTIFLDFDGVLHGESIDSNGLFEHMSLFCETVRPFINNLNIVISSSWRETHKLESLRILFEKDIRNCVIGVTPVHKTGYEDDGREKEIREYCLMNNLDDSSWVALDDMDRLFSPICKNLILTDPQTGLDIGEIKALEYFLKK